MVFGKNVLRMMLRVVVIMVVRIVVGKDVRSMIELNQLN